MPVAEIAECATGAAAWANLRAPERCVILTVENAGIVPAGD
jgi:hypothetical protein